MASQEAKDCLHVPLSSILNKIINRNKKKKEKEKLEVKIKIKLKML